MLLDIKDLRSILQYAGENAASFTTEYGRISRASVGAIQRKLLSLEDQGGDIFFGEPALNLDDFLQKAQTLYPDLSLKASFDLIQSREKGAYASRSVSTYDPWMIIASRLAEFMVEELWPFMQSIPCPTLIVRGEYSTFVSDDEAENMCQMIPNAEIAVIPRASHLPMIENQIAFKEAVLSFLD